MLPSTSHQQQLIVIGFVGVIVAALLYVYFYLLEWKEEEINLGYSVEAQRNSMLAAQLFLARQDVANERVINFTLLDNVYPDPQSADKVVAGELGELDTLVLLNARGTIHGRRFANLWRWLEGGGTLITTIENPYIGSLRREDELFQELGVALEQDDRAPDFSLTSIVDEMEKLSGKKDGADAGRGEAEDGQQEKPPSTFMFSDAFACREKNFVEVVLPADVSALKVDFGHGDFFSYDHYFPEWLVTEERDGGARTLAAAFPIGAGRVVILRSAVMWHNPFIQCHDHAYFLWSLINRRGKVWFLENRDAPSLFSLLLRHLPYVFVALCLSLVLTVWSALTRFGPVFGLAEISRRSFAEHIRASATFLWQNSRYQLLVGDLRIAIEQRLADKARGYEKKSEDEKLQYIVKFTSVEAEVARIALFKADIATINEFVQIVRTLKEIKDNL